MTLTELNAGLAAPEIFLLSATCVVLLVDIFLKDHQRVITYMLSLLALLGTALIMAQTVVDGRETAFVGSFVMDPAAKVLKLFALASMAVVFIYSRSYLRQQRLLGGDYYLLALFAVLGILVMISASSLLTMYMGLELMSLSVYALVAFNRDSPVAAEAAMKYFVLGAIASGSLLYGISMIYGATGSINLAEIAATVAAGEAMMLPMALGLSFVLVGIAFKFGAVPFHMWLPDVYQGAPTSVTLFIGSVPKIASFALVLRVLIEGLGDMYESWAAMIVILAVLSMVLGNVVAIAQANLKRMLAYSTISHVGFILVGFLAGTAAGVQGAMYYTLVYVIMALGAFGMIILLSRQGFEAENLEDFKGLNARSPWFAFIMLLIMFSMAGVPPFVGFYAKVAVFGAAIEAGYTWLAIVGVLFSVIGAYYYLRVVWYMYFEPPAHEVHPAPEMDMKFMVSLNGLALLALGLLPGPLLTLVGSVIPG
jgi:NADH-quinone oxidoreductase subunit N